jgi:hypothetical protein
MTPGNALVAERIQQESSYLSVPEVSREVVTPLPKLKRYDLMHPEPSC